MRAVVNLATIGQRQRRNLTVELNAALPAARRYGSSREPTYTLCGGDGIVGLSAAPTLSPTATPTLSPTAAPTLSPTFPVIFNESARLRTCIGSFTCRIYDSDSTTLA